MLASWITWYDVLFWTIAAIVVTLAVVSYRYGYAVGYSEGQHQKRMARRQAEKEMPEWATSVRIVNRRPGRY